MRAPPRRSNDAQICVRVAAGRLVLVEDLPQTLDKGSVVGVDNLARRLGHQRHGDRLADAVDELDAIREEGEQIAPADGESEGDAELADEPSAYRQGLGYG